MPLGADDMQATRVDDMLVQRLPFIVEKLHPALLVRVSQRRIGFDQLRLLLDVTAQDDVGTAPGHVGGNRDGFRSSGLRDDFSFARVLLGVQHVVRQLGFGQNRRQQLGVFNRCRTDQYRLTTLVAILDVGQHRLVFLLVGLVDLILSILALIRPILRNHHGFQTVDFLELVRFRVGSTGHAGQLAVHAEIILERDRRQRLVFVLNLDVLFGFDCLMQAIRPAPPGHQPTGEFIDDHDFVVLHDVVLILVIQHVGPQRCIQMMNQRDIGGVVQRCAFG